VHGDFRLDNVLVTVSPQPRITAVVDWEMATLGDPLADLGLTLVYWTDPGEEGWLTPEQKSAGGPLAAGVSTDATASPGFLSRAEFAAGYARRTGRDISRIRVLRGVRLLQARSRPRRHQRPLPAAQTVGEGFDQDGLAVPALVTRAHEVLDADATS